jgi:hypothetical protein
VQFTFNFQRRISLGRYSIDIDPGTFGTAPNTKFIIPTFTTDDGQRGSLLGLNRQEKWLGHSGLSNAEVRNEWRYTFTSPPCLHGIVW